MRLLLWAVVAAGLSAEIASQREERTAVEVPAPRPPFGRWAHPAHLPPNALSRHYLGGREGMWIF